ncbi:unnamed protein product [Effrenium voratum]|nr:unnamed protein product [Effrenium voratum]
MACEEVNKEEQIRALQQRSRGMMRLTRESRRLEATVEVQAAPETDAKIRRELEGLRSDRPEVMKRTRSEAALESQLAEKHQSRLETEQRVWAEERRKMRAAQSRSLQNEKEVVEQLRRHTEELAAAKKKLDSEAREAQQARQRQRAAESKLKRTEEKQETYVNLVRVEAMEAEAQAQAQQEAALMEATHLRGRLAQAEDEALQRQLAALSVEGTSKDASLELGASKEALRIEECQAARARRDAAFAAAELKDLDEAFQAVVVEHELESRMEEEQAHLAEQAALLAADLRQRLRRSSQELQQLQMQHQDLAESVEAHGSRRRSLELLELRRKEEELNASSRMARLLQHTLAEEQSSRDACREELQLATEECQDQRLRCQEEHRELQGACEAALNGLPLHFYEEVCRESQAGGEGDLTMARYGHILEAVAQCVRTLLRENTQLQAQGEGGNELRASTSTLGQLALTPLSLSLDRPEPERSFTAPELHREVFAMHQELSGAREEVRQLTQQSLGRGILRSRAKNEVQQMQSEMEDLQAQHARELELLQSELASAKAEKAKSLSFASESSREAKSPPSPGGTSRSLRAPKTPWKRVSHIEARTPSASSGGPGPGENEALSKAFAYAEALCEGQRYKEALPLLREVMQVGRGRGLSELRLADVAAYIGVATQAEGRTDEALAAYCEAIRLDPSLHVCHANLASLYQFLDQPQQAREHLAQALQLDPSNRAYVELARSLR